MADLDVSFNMMVACRFRRDTARYISNAEWDDYTQGLFHANPDEYLRVLQWRYQNDPRFRGANVAAAASDLPEGRDHTP